MRPLKEDVVPVVASVIVGAILAMWLLLFVWSTARAFRASRHRAPLRTAAEAPQGMVLGVREPEALRAPFVLTLRGDVIDVAQSMHGSFRGEPLGITDLTVRHEPGSEPVNVTVVTLEVAARWPWMRLRRKDVAAPPSGRGEVTLAATGASAWILEAADPDLAAALVTAELLAWLERGAFELQLELTPRHLLVAVQGQVSSDRLTELRDLVTGIIDHVPAKVAAAVAPPRPQDDN
ncbi:MAG: hypothetical protein ACI867_002213 [Glaciecola sp.]